MDVHEDFPAVLRELTDILGEQAAQTVEMLRFNVLKAGTNVFYANGVLRTDVNTPVSLVLQRRITRALKRQNASPHTTVVKSTPAYNTQPIEASYIGLIHPDLENDIRNINGFISTKHYASVQPMEGEIGAVEDVRYIRSTVFQPWADAGGAAGSTMLSTTGTQPQVRSRMMATARSRLSSRRQVRTSSVMTSFTRYMGAPPRLFGDFTRLQGFAAGPLGFARRSFSRSMRFRATSSLCSIASKTNECADCTAS